MIGSTMLTYALYAGMLRDAGLKANTVTAYIDNEVASVEDPNRSLRVETKTEVSDSIKKSPKYRDWAFSHVSSAYGQDRAGESFLLRFRVLAQDGQTIQTMGHDASRMLIRLWDYNVSRLKNPHKPPYYLIDVYLADGGTAGGEHLLTLDEDEKDNNNQDRKASVIHIFQVKTLTDKVEAVRELAHEYGHATYPHVGVFDAPESWGNGYAAERIFIKWLYEDLKAKKLNTTDTMGATEDQFAIYLASKVDPLVKRMGLNGPNMTLLAGKSKESFDEYIALNSYAEAILPRPAFARALVLGSSETNATVFAKGVVDAAAEREELPIAIPPVLKGQAMWVPLSKGTIKGAKVLERKGSWAKVQPTSATVIINNPPVD